MSVTGNSKSHSQVWVVRVFAVIALLVSGISFAALEDDIRERLQPAGTVCVAGDACASAIAVTVSADAGPRTAEQIYKTSCFACHDTGVSDAPVLGNAEHWQPRIDKGIDALYQSSISGIENTVMQAKGGCIDCSDAELQATVDFMVNSL